MLVRSYVSGTRVPDQVQVITRTSYTRTEGIPNPRFPQLLITRVRVLITRSASILLSCILYLVPGTRYTKVPRTKYISTLVLSYFRIFRTHIYRTGTVPYVQFKFSKLYLVHVHKSTQNSFVYRVHKRETGSYSHTLYGIPYYTYTFVYLVYSCTRILTSSPLYTLYTNTPLLYCTPPSYPLPPPYTPPPHIIHYITTYYINIHTQLLRPFGQDARTSKINCKGKSAALPVSTR